MDSLSLLELKPVVICLNVFHSSAIIREDMILPLSIIGSAKVTSNNVLSTCMKCKVSKQGVLVGP